MFVHMVYFWLKPESREARVEEMIRAGRSLLQDIPEIRHLWLGSPAMTPRPVVNNTFHVGLGVVFDDRAGHDSYQVHPRHREFTERFRPWWETVTVFDVVE